MSHILPIAEFVPESCAYLRNSEFRSSPFHGPGLWRTHIKHANGAISEIRCTFEDTHDNRTRFALSFYMLEYTGEYGPKEHPELQDLLNGHSLVSCEPEKIEYLLHCVDKLPSKPVAASPQ